jgi:hypothetical protein
MVFLADLRLYQEGACEKEGRQAYLETKEINKVVYTMQQAIAGAGTRFSALPNRRFVGLFKIKDNSRAIDVDLFIVLSSLL